MERGERRMCIVCSGRTHPFVALVSVLSLFKLFPLFLRMPFLGFLLLMCERRGVGWMWSVKCGERGVKTTRGERERRGRTKTMHRGGEEVFHSCLFCVYIDNDNFFVEIYYSYTNTNTNTSTCTERSVILLVLRHYFDLVSEVAKSVYSQLFSTMSCTRR